MWVGRLHSLLAPTSVSFAFLVYFPILLHPGITLQYDEMGDQGLYIESLTAGLPAARDGRLRVGDRIIGRLSLRITICPWITLFPSVTLASFDTR